MVEKIATCAAQPIAASDYLFHLDALPPEVSFRRRIEITGWLLHWRGQPIHGLRGIVKSRCAARASTKGDGNAPGRPLALLIRIYPKRI
jgi:hypothetical protein